MVLLETLTLHVGPAIAKTLLKLWLKDNSIAEDIGLSLLDVLKKKGLDVLSQQRAKRQFEDVGDKIIESLMPIFEKAAITENGRTAVALEVASTLDQARIDSKLLVEEDLDPYKLAEHIRTSRADATRDFSEAETELYHRIITETSVYMVHIASELPIFTEHAFSALLKKGTWLQDKTNQILDELRHLREESRAANTDEKGAQFEEEYRRSVARSLDRLELFGLDNLTRASRSHRLSVAYISLEASHEIRNDKQKNERLLQPDSDRALGNNRSTERQSTFIQPIENVLANKQRLIIRGQAGSGKTTLLKWIAVKSARGNFVEELSDWNGSVPFFIPLRQCLEGGLPAPEDFPRFVAAPIADTMPKGWVHDHLRSGRAIVLVDSVDEVPQLQRAEVYTWLKQLTETYDKSRFILTSRPSAIEEGWMKAEGFADAELQPMALPSINTFIDYWHAAVQEALEEAGYKEEAEELETLAGNLKEEVRARRPILNLATSPLLCAALCALHRDRHQQVPADRIELYEALCAMLLERRGKEQNLKVEAQDYPQLTYRQKIALLKDIAYWMMTNTLSVAPISRVEERIDNKLKSIVDVPSNISASEVRRLLIDRSGMVREPVIGQLDFTHRTFQEFLSAKAALDNGDIGFLCQHANDDQWREVIILAVGLATRESDRRELISGLIERGNEEEALRHQLHLLAVACLESVAELAPDLQGEVQKQLAKLVPPKNMTEAKAIASAGDLAVPYLKFKRAYKSTEAAACVRALALIGNEAALDALSTYTSTSETRQRVLRELFRAIEWFDDDEYFQKVISKLRLKELSWEPTHSLIGLEHLRSLNRLRLYNGGKVEDLSPLGEISTLKSLSIWSFEAVTDITPLGRLTNLEELELKHFRHLEDLSSLGALTKLEVLRVYAYLEMANLDFLSKLTNLTLLELGYLESVTSLESISRLHKLKSLMLSGAYKIEDLSPLTNLTSLESLRLWGSPKVHDISPLGQLVQLTSLDLNGCQHLKDLQPLTEITHLVSLSLSDMDELTDLAPLAKLSNLTDLSLQGLGHVRDYRPLNQLRGLRFLDIDRGVPKDALPEQFRDLARLPRHHVLHRR